jgi:hypothetical protein
MKRYVILAVCIATVTLGACAKESSFPKATGEGAIRALNAIPASPEIVFLIEERVVGTVTSKGVTATTVWDDLEYTFNFQTLLAGDSTTTRVASQFLNVGADNDYTFVISGALAAPDITIWELRTSQSGNPISANGSDPRQCSKHVWQTWQSRSAALIFISPTW